ncbi:DUF4190 domain-containing protein [Nocardioides insulae]|uniref:DUF4190 domain-containing protein n=1 Tax=Nocardioides insulae TaxID=394734 RepID=UPI000686B6C2|nr:DUF4190 domain-containing protein [Nocardioides insulae]
MAHPDPDQSQPSRGTGEEPDRHSVQPPAPYAPPLSPYGQPPSYLPPHPYAAPSPYGQPYYAQPAQTSGVAITALVLGLVSIVVGCGLFLGIPAMIVGRRATRQIDESQGRLTGRGLAQAGFWTGLAGTVLWGLFYLAYFGLMATVLFLSESASTTSNV